MEGNDWTSRAKAPSPEQERKLYAMSREYDRLTFAEARGTPGARAARMEHERASAEAHKGMNLRADDTGYRGAKGADLERNRAIMREIWTEQGGRLTLRERITDVRENIAEKVRNAVDKFRAKEWKEQLQPSRPLTRDEVAAIRRDTGRDHSTKDAVQSRNGQNNERMQRGIMKQARDRSHEAGSYHTPSDEWRSGRNKLTPTDYRALAEREEARHERFAARAAERGHTSAISHTGSVRDSTSAGNWQPGQVRHIHREATARVPTDADVRNMYQRSVRENQARAKEMNTGRGGR